MAAVEAAEEAAATAAEATVANIRESIFEVGTITKNTSHDGRKCFFCVLYVSLVFLFALTSYLRQGSYGILFLQKYSCGTHPS